MMICVKIIAVLCTALCRSSANAEIQDWTNLKVTYGYNPLSSFKFNSMPRTVYEAEKNGWGFIGERSCSNGGKYNGCRYIQGDDISVALMYDIQGVIAGIQMNILKSDILSENNSYRFDRVGMFQDDIIRDKEVYTLTAYFVDPSTICTTGRSLEELKRGTGILLTFQNGPTPNDLIEVPFNRSRATQEGWSKLQCVFGMGSHNIYEVEKIQSNNCLDVRPLFLLYNKAEELHGFVFLLPGKANSTRFEHPNRKILEDIFGVDAPPCIWEILDTIGFTSIHVYFVDQPYVVNCY